MALISIDTDKIENNIAKLLPDRHQKKSATTAKKTVKTVPKDRSLGIFTSSDGDEPPSIGEVLLDMVDDIPVSAAALSLL